MAAQATDTKTQLFDPQTAAAMADGMGRLTVLRGPTPGVVHPLYSRRMRLGRLLECEIPLATRGISKTHCTVEQMEGGGHGIRDEGSRNGTLLNGIRIEKGILHELATGDQITVCEWTFVYLAPMEPNEENRPIRIEVNRGEASQEASRVLDGFPELAALQREKRRSRK